MGGELETIGIAEARSALAWWLEAGVDVAVQEEARDWLKPASPKAQPAESAAVANVVEPSHETLAELQQWLASSAQLPLASATARRILPHGPENAAVMLLSDAPSLEDLGAGQPIGGAAWELAKKMLAAIARRHIGLAKPRRLLLLGDGPAQALLGKPLAQARGHVHKIEGVRAVATFHPRQLIQNSANKSYAWKDLLLLMEDEA